MALAFRDVSSIIRRRIAPLALCMGFFCLVSIGAQDRLRSMPGYEQSQKMQATLQGGAAFVSGSITPSWASDGQAFTYTHAGKNYRFEIATLTSTERVSTQPERGGGRGAAGAAAGNGIPGGNAGRGAQTTAQTEMPAEPVQGCPHTSAARGRQLDCAMSPDGKLKAFYRARNLWIANADGTNEKQITTDGRFADQIAS